MSVICTPTVPAGRGFNQILPVANDLNGLATFENLINAYSGPDGADTLAYALDRIAVLNRWHTRPLRVVLLNPPEPSRLLPRLAKVLKQRRKETLACLSLELYATKDHAARIQAALRFSGAEREILEEQISNGRLRIRAHEKPVVLHDFLSDLQKRPCHVLAVFDEATIRIRRRGAGQHLPMSPFCVRHEITYDKHANTIRLAPTSDEPPFSEFMQLVNEAQGEQRDSTPHAWADAESLKKVVDKVLQGDAPAAQWLFLADRALPSEAGMTSVRLLQKRDGQRQVLLCTASHARLAHVVRPVFAKCNLRFDEEELRVILEEGVNLVGAGLLDLVDKHGKPDRNHVVGLAGMLLAARDYRRRHPEALLVSVDSEVTRLWLRLGDKTERCDLLAVRKAGEGFVMEAIEVKSSALADMPVSTLVKAQEQALAVVSAIADAMPDNTAGRDPLSAPRCEMVKEVLVRGCQSRAVPVEKRAAWSGWLKAIFLQEPGPPPAISFSGEVVLVMLRSNHEAADYALADEPFPLRCRTLSESTIQELIEGVAPAGPPPDEPPPVAPAPKPPVKPGPPPPLEPEPAAPVVFTPVPVASPLPLVPSSPAPQVNSPVAHWPPPLNELGMIGQYEAVTQMIQQVNYSKAKGRRAPDKLFVGPAGVGKSSLARAIAGQLLHTEAILFNGADFKTPSMLVELLIPLKKVPAKPKGTVQIQPCLIFIDEVHAISKSVETMLLSALDDERVTSIDNVIYHFGDVVFMLATTDSSKLSEAFNSRPDKTYLRPYTLEEMAGILCLHGKNELEGWELSREVCIEIAARMRCNPRRAVRLLRDNMISHFHALTHQGNDAIDPHLIAAMMSVEAVAAFFEDKGIDLNGLNSQSKNYLRYLQRNGATPKDRLRQSLGISNKADFEEETEYLQIRLDLVTVNTSGCSLTAQGRKYLEAPLDLRGRISRQQ